MTMTVPPWVKDAACNGADTGRFFPERGGHQAEPSVTEVYCEGCPVREECLAFGLHMEYGVWGGLNANERRLLRKTGTPAR